MDMVTTISVVFYKRNLEQMVIQSWGSMETIPTVLCRSSFTFFSPCNENLTHTNSKHFA